MVYSAASIYEAPSKIISHFEECDNRFYYICMDYKKSLHKNARFI